MKIIWWVLIVAVVIMLLGGVGWWIEERKSGSSPSPKPDPKPKPKPGSKYSCDGSKCVADSKGTYNDPNCSNACPDPKPGSKYSCDGSKCVADSKGTYNDPNCSNACPDPKPGSKYSCDGSKCVADSKGTYNDPNCWNQCEKLPLLCYIDTNIDSKLAPSCKFTQASNKTGECWNNCYNQIKNNSNHEIKPANVVGVISNENRLCSCWDISLGPTTSKPDTGYTVATSTSSNLDKNAGNKTKGTICSYNKYDPGMEPNSCD